MLGLKVVTVLLPEVELILLLKVVLMLVLEVMLVMLVREAALFVHVH